LATKSLWENISAPVIRTQAINALPKSNLSRDSNETTTKTALLNFIYSHIDTIKDKVYPPLQNRSNEFASMDKWEILNHYIKPKHCLWWQDKSNEKKNLFLVKQNIFEQCGIEFVNRERYRHNKLMLSTQAVKERDSDNDNSELDIEESDHGFSEE